MSSITHTDRLNRFTTWQDQVNRLFEGAFPARGTQSDLTTGRPP